MRTHKQQLADILKQKIYKGCRGQITDYSNNGNDSENIVFEIFSPPKKTGDWYLMATIAAA